MAAQPPAAKPGNGEVPTPAQQQYGLVHNPDVGALPDLDLTHAFTLDRAIHIALLRQPTIAIARTQREAAAAQLAQARSSYFPQVTPQVQYSASRTPVGGGGGGGGGSASGGAVNSEVFSESITAKQLIFDMGRREASVEGARHGVTGSDYSIADARATVILSVTQAWYNTLRDRELQRVQQENVNRAQTTLDAVNLEIQVGTAAKSDALQAQSDLANAKVSLLQAQSNYDVDQASLKNALGVVSPGQLLLPEATAANPAVGADTLGIPHYVDVAFDNRPDVLAQLEHVRQQGFNVQIARINTGLDIEANVSEGYSFNNAVGEQREFLVTFSYPLFDGGASRAALRGQKAQLESERRNLDALEQQVHLDVEQAWNVREVAKQQVAAAQTAVDAGKLNYAATLEKQKSGVGNILDVLNAQVQLVTAEVSLVQSVYSYYTAEAQLQRATGMNDPEYASRLPHHGPSRVGGGATQAAATPSGEKQR